MKAILIVFLFCSLCHGQSVSDLYQNSGLPGFSIAKVNQDGLVYTKSFGYSNLETSSKRDSSTKQNIASVTKTFVGVALLKAVQKGLLSLETPINEILPFKVVNPKHPNVPITVRMLATHTSSIRDHKIEYKSVILPTKISMNQITARRNTKKYFKKWNSNNHYSLSDFLQLALVKGGRNYSPRRYANEKPGSTHAYSNLGAGLAGYIVELVTEMPLHEYISQEIIAPLELLNTGWDFEEADDLAAYYFENRTPVPDYVSLLYPAGGLNSTCEDLSKYLSELIKCYSGEDGILTTTNAKIMFSDQLSTSQNTLSGTKSYGIFSNLNGTSKGHNGGNYGVTILMSFDSETREGKIFMTNISSYETSHLLTTISKIHKSI